MTKLVPGGRSSTTRVTPGFLPMRGAVSSAPGRAIPLACPRSTLGSLSFAPGRPAAGAGSGPLALPGASPGGSWLAPEPGARLPVFSPGAGSARPGEPLAGGGETEGRALRLRLDARTAVRAGRSEGDGADGQGGGGRGSRSDDLIAAHLTAHAAQRAAADGRAEFQNQHPPARGDGRLTGPPAAAQAQREGSRQAELRAAGRGRHPVLAHARAELGGDAGSRPQPPEVEPQPAETRREGVADPGGQVVDHLGLAALAVDARQAETGPTGAGQAGSWAARSWPDSGRWPAQRARAGSAPTGPLLAGSWAAGISGARPGRLWAGAPRTKGSPGMTPCAPAHEPRDALSSRPADERIFKARCMSGTHFRRRGVRKAQANLTRVSAECGGHAIRLPVFPPLYPEGMTPPPPSTPTGRA